MIRPAEFCPTCIAEFGKRLAMGDATTERGAVEVCRFCACEFVRDGRAFVRVHPDDVTFARWRRSVRTQAAGKPA